MLLVSATIDITCYRKQLRKEKTVGEALREHSPESKRAMLKPNLEALERGAESARPVVFPTST